MPVEDIWTIQHLCHEKDDDIRWLIALLSDTGMRLAEAASLAKEDVFLDTEIRHIRICERPWRPLKTRSSERDTPILTVHDSFIVPFGTERQLDRAMNEAFEYVTYLQHVKAKYNQHLTEA